MSGFPIPTNFSGLVTPRVVHTTIFSTPSSGIAMGTLAAVPLLGTLGSGAVIVGAYLTSGSSGTNTYTLSVTGAAAGGGSVATFVNGGVTPATLAAQYGVPLTQDSYVTITSLSTTAQLPKAIITYLA